MISVRVDGVGSQNKEVVVVVHGKGSSQWVATLKDTNGVLTVVPHEKFPKQLNKDAVGRIIGVGNYNSKLETILNDLSQSIIKESDSGKLTLEWLCNIANDFSDRLIQNYFECNSKVA